MRKFLVNVSGTPYEVTIEEVGGKTASKAPPAPPAAGGVPERISAPAAAPVKPAQTAGGSRAVNAPIPGSILQVRVKPGDAVKAGDVLMILEAMKMENEICAPVDGVVGQVHVQAGATVESGAALCSLH